MPVDQTPTQQALTLRLVSLARARRVPQTTIARAVGLSQSAFNRLWHGSRLPDEREIGIWLDQVSADDATRAEVRALADAARTSGHRWHGRGDAQAAVDARIRTATTVCSWQQSILPGLLQTAAYARRVLEEEPTVPDDEVPARVQRRVDGQAALYQGGRIFRFVIAQHVLDDDMPVVERAAQLDRLASLSTLDTVEIYYLQPDRALGAPMVPFTIYGGGPDGDVALLELPHQDLQVLDPADVAVYRDAFDRLLDDARRWPPNT